MVFKLDYIDIFLALRFKIKFKYIYWKNKLLNIHFFSYVFAYYIFV